MEKPNRSISNTASDFANIDRQKLWDLQKKISDLQINLEAEKTRNSHLEENYTKLPATIESLHEARADLEYSKNMTFQLEQKLRESQTAAAKYRKDLEDFRDFAFREIKEKELFIISQSSSLRTLQNEQHVFREQCQKLCEEYEGQVKNLKSYKIKYRKAKIELEDLRKSAASSKIDAEYLNLKLDLECLQRKNNDLVKSREELARKCTELENKNQHLSSQKNEFKKNIHRRDRTLVEMEIDFKSTLENLESKKEEETVEMQEKINGLERLIKEMKKHNEEEMNKKEDSNLKERLKNEDLKKQIEKTNKEKLRVESELLACKNLLDEANGKVIEIRINFESQIEAVKKEHKDKIFGMKAEIAELIQKNKELLETMEVINNRESIFVGNSLANELSGLNRESRLELGSFRGESIFRFNSDLDKNSGKLKTVKEKKKKLKQELAAKNELLNELEVSQNKNEKNIRNLNSDILGLQDMINDLKITVKTLEQERNSRDLEIQTLNTLNSDLVSNCREQKEKILNIENELSRQKSLVEESVQSLKKKYNDKILKYKEDILELTQNSAMLRDNLTNTRTLTEVQASQLEESKKLLKKNNKLKEKVNMMEKGLKSKSDLINKLQSKLTELYRIPNINEELEETLPSIDEKIETDQTEQKTENKNLKEKNKELEQQINSLLKLVKSEKEIIIIYKTLSPENFNFLMEKRESKKPDYSLENFIEKTEPFQQPQMETEDFMKIETLNKKIQKLAVEMSFSIEIIQSSIILPSEKTGNLNENQELRKIDKLSLSENCQVYLLSLGPASSVSQDLEMKVFRLEQDLVIKSERFLKAEKDYQSRIIYLEGQIKKLQDESSQYAYTINTEIDECSDSEEEKSNIPSKKIAVSIIEDLEPATEGSIIEPAGFRSRFSVLRESILMMKPAESVNSKISDLEKELAEKSNELRKHQENMKDIQSQLDTTKNKNSELVHTIQKLEEKLAAEKKNNKKQDFKGSLHDCILIEAKITLQEAHNQRLETELIVSKTNWGEMTNSLIRDINEMEIRLKEAEKDYRTVALEKEELVKKFKEKSKKSKWSLFNRKKRNSDIN